MNQRINRKDFEDIRYNRTRTQLLTQMYMCIYIHCIQNNGVYLIFEKYSFFHKIRINTNDDIDPVTENGRYMRYIHMSLSYTYIYLNNLSYTINKEYHTLVMSDISNYRKMFYRNRSTK